MRAAEEKTFTARTKESQRLATRAEKHLPGSVPMGWMRGLYRTAPIFIDRGVGATFTDVDGNDYLDFNVCDLSMTMGFGPQPIVDAVSQQIRVGAHYLLPTTDAVEVAEDLATRTGVPYWQFTISASGANTEVIRVARFMTGRKKIVVFSGKYHGHIDETLVDGDDIESAAEVMGISTAAAANTINIPFNSLPDLERVLANDDVALVLLEPALTNCNIVLPQPGFLDDVRALTKRHGTLLCYDEAHTFQFAYGGLVGKWKLDTDFHVVGKGMGSGISFALYGMSAAVAEVFAQHIDDDVLQPGIATGGTTYASALTVAAAKASLQEILTPDNYQQTIALGKRLADGLDGVFADVGLPWTAFRLGPRSGYCMSAKLPTNYEEAADSLDYDLIDTRRIYMANRGIWDAIASAGPQVSFAHRDDHVDRYLQVAREFLSNVVE